MPGKTLRLRWKGPRSAKSKRRQWQPVVIYSGLVILAGIALAAWDRAYEARRGALFQPPPPPVLARELVEGFVGSGTVESVAFDDKAEALEMSVKDVVTKPGQTGADVRKNLTFEGTQAIQILQNGMPRLKTITLHLVRDGKVLATARTKPGETTPPIEFSSDLK